MIDPAAAAKLLPFAQYQRTQIAEIRPYVPGESLEDVSISVTDEMNGSPMAGDMIARNPDNHYDQWLVAAKYFADNFVPVNTRQQPAPPASLTPIAVAENHRADAAVAEPTGTIETISAPPAGEPDFMREAETFARKENAPFGVERLLRQFGQRMYYLGLSVRPKVEDAEVSEALAQINGFLGGTLKADKDAGHAMLREWRDLLERLAGELARVEEEWAEVRPQIDRHITRAETAETKLAGLEAELAKADAVCEAVRCDGMGDLYGPPYEEWFLEACNRHAARQQQKASEEQTDNEGNE